MAQKSRPWFSSLFSIDRLFGFKGQLGKGRRKRSVQLTVEALEDRTVPTVVFDPFYGTETPTKAAPYTVTSNPTVHLIFWGSNWSSGADATLETNIIADAQTILSGTYLNDLTEYGSSGTATFGKTFNDTTNPPAGYDAGSNTTKDSGGVNTSATDLNNEITSVLNNAASGIPKPTSPDVTKDPIYVVIVAPEVSNTNGGYNIPGTYGADAINMVSVGTKFGVEDNFTETFGHEIAERMTDAKFDGSGVELTPPAALPFGPTSPFGTASSNFQIGDGEAEPGGQHHFGYRVNGPNGVEVQPYYSVNTAGLNGVKGVFLAADGNKQTLYLDPIWNTTNPADPILGDGNTPLYNLTINGDQLPSVNDSIILSGFTSNQGGTGLSVNLNGEKFQFDPKTIQKITINGLTGGNTLTLDFSTGNFLPTKGISFDGGTGASGLLVLKGGTFTNETDTATGAHSGTINLDGKLVTYSNLSPIIDTSTATTLTIKDATAGDTVNIKNDPSSPENGFATSEINGGGFEKMDFANKANVVFTDISGGGGDTFNVVNALVGGATLTINGSGVGNTLNGPNQTDAWNITTGDGGNITGLVNSFTDIQNLAGGTGADTFTFSVGATMGTIAGGGGNDTIDGANQPDAWNITGADAGSITSVLNSFTAIQNLAGGTGADTFTFGVGATMGSIVGGGGNDTIDGANQVDTWNITGADAGSITGVLTSFTAIENLVGNSGADTFVFSVGATMGTIDGGGGNNAIDGANQTDAWSITGPNAGGVTGVLTSFVNIQNLVGGSGTDTFAFSVGATMGSINGGGGNDTIDGANQADAWNITGPDAGNITGVLTSFVTIQNLVGGTGADTFFFSVGATMGAISGGGGTNNTIVGANQPDTWNITGPNAGNIASVLTSFTIIQNLVGGSGNDLFLFSAGATEGAVNGGGGNNTLVGGPNQTNDFFIAGSNSGAILGALPTFTSIQNLAGSTAAGDAGVDIFEFFAGGGLSGQVMGGAGTEWLDYDPLSMPIWVNLAGGGTYGTGTGLTHLAASPMNVIGSAVGGDMLIGDASGGILEGHNSNNTILAGTGRTIIIGGYGRNYLQGNAADDLIINGSTYFDLDIYALADIQAEWRSADTFATRVNDIRYGVGLTDGYHFALGASVFCPSTAPGPRFGRGGGNGQSTLIGGGGQNWFFTLYATDVLDLQPTDQID